MERKVGEIFTYNGKIYKVVPGYGCENCDFKDLRCLMHTFSEVRGACDSSMRKDNNNVIFKEVKKHMDIKNNQLTIDIPEGMEIDLENSDLAKGIIRFKQITITYENVEDALKLGKKVRRKCWSGDKFLYYVPSASYPAMTDIAKSIADKDGKVLYKEYIAIRCKDGDVGFYTPTQCDVLAEDWEIVVK